MDQATYILAGINITLAIFVLGLAYSAGRHVNRIDNLENAIREIKQSMHDLSATVKSEIRDVHGHIQRVEKRFSQVVDE